VEMVTCTQLKNSVQETSEILRGAQKKKESAIQHEVDILLINSASQQFSMRWGPLKSGRRSTHWVVTHSLNIIIYFIYIRSSSVFFCFLLFSFW
jgi:hypothetical protein